MDYSGYALPWWGEGDTASSLLEAIARIKEGLADASTLSRFQRSSYIVFPYLSNKLEGTLPAALKEQETYKILEDFFKPEVPIDVSMVLQAPKQHWPAEGLNSSGTASRAQLIQTLSALQYLCIDCKPGSQPLTVSMIRTTHRLMMWGAVDEDGVLLNAGEFRSMSAYSGTGFVYPSHEFIPAGLERIVSDYNESWSTQAPELAAAQLLYDVITLHPFSNGNGRVCRLLTAYALIAGGCPFPVTLSNGHKRARKHYERCLLYADKHPGDMRRLTCFILECVHQKWSNLQVISKFS